MATREAPIHDSVKQQLVDADERQTQLVYRRLRNTARIFKNNVAQQVAEIEQNKPDVTIQDLAELVSGEKGRMVLERGEMEAGVWSAGMVAGLIKDIPTCKELVTRIVREAEEIILARLDRALV
jgi:NAD(P)H-dependent flavin oxidoreductase YrpB (nitropropane dioxygenase family)